MSKSEYSGGVVTKKGDGKGRKTCYTMKPQWV